MNQTIIGIINLVGGMLHQDSNRCQNWVNMMLNAMNSGRCGPDLSDAECVLIGELQAAIRQMSPAVKQTADDGTMTLTLTWQEKQILQSALYEYCTQRNASPGDPECTTEREVQKYVDRRYPESEGYSQSFRGSKLANVVRCTKLAAEIRGRTFNVQ